MHSDNRNKNKKGFTKNNHSSTKKKHHYHIHDTIELKPFNISMQAQSNTDTELQQGCYPWHICISQKKVSVPQYDHHTNFSHKPSI